MYTPMEPVLPMERCGCDKYGECLMHESEREADENRCDEMIMERDGSLEHRCFEPARWTQIMVPRTDDKVIMVKDSEISTVCEACKDNNESYFADPDTGFQVFFYPY